MSKDLLFHTMNLCRDGDKNQQQAFIDQVTLNRTLLMEFSQISVNEEENYEFIPYQYAAYYDIIDCFKFLDEIYGFFKELYDKVPFHFIFNILFFLIFLSNFHFFF